MRIVYQLLDYNNILGLTIPPQPTLDGRELPALSANVRLPRDREAERGMYELLMAITHLLDAYEKQTPQVPRFSDERKPNYGVDLRERLPVRERDYQARYGGILPVRRDLGGIPTRFL